MKTAVSYVTALQNRTIILITSKAAKTFSVKSEEVKLKSQRLLRPWDFGAPARIRTGGLSLRRGALYPAELQTHTEHRR